MSTLFQLYDEATASFDDSMCSVCSLCGDLRMRGPDNDDDETQDLDHGSARLMQQELRYLRQNYQGLKVAVDKILDDHEGRIRGLGKQVADLENQKYLVIGAGGRCGVARQRPDPVICQMREGI